MSARRAAANFITRASSNTAVKLSSDLINHQPDAQLPYLVRAKSEQGLKRYAAAAEDYATLIRLLPNTKLIVSEVFTRMSDSYERLGRPCEAIGPFRRISLLTVKAGRRRRF
jgi:tetratricopeptide (TPR) repeat protein